jgi:hypothetical protein
MQETDNDEVNDRVVKPKLGCLFVFVTQTQGV